MENIYKELFNSNFEKDALDEMNQLLEEELSKKPSERNYNKIEELTRAYSELSDEEDFIHEASERGIKQFTEQNVKQSQIHMTRNLRLWLTVVCLVVVMAILNTISVVAFDMNAFSFIVHVVDNGFSVDFFSKEVPSESVVQIPVSEDDPYGMIAECAKNGIYPETPHYLPEGYVLTLCRYSNMPKFRQGMKFTFKNQNNANESICFMYDIYESKEYMTNAKFSNVEHNLREIEINGKTAVLAEEKKDKQFTIVYHIDNLLISIFTFDMSADEVYKIIESIK